MGAECHRCGRDIYDECGYCEVKDQRDALAHLVFTYGDRLPSEDLEKVWGSIVLPIVVADAMDNNQPGGTD